MDFDTVLKYARIIVNLFLLVLDLSGFKIPVSSNVKSSAIQEVGRFLWMNPVARMAIKTFLVAIENARRKGDLRKMIVSIINLVGALQLFGIPWIIIENILYSMSMWERFMCFTQASLNLTTVFSTGGLSFVTKLAGCVLSLKNVFDLIKDVL